MRLRLIGFLEGRANGEFDQTLKDAKDQQFSTKNSDEKSESQVISGSGEGMNLFDVTQILSSFSKLKLVKSELFELLELYFIKNLNKATPDSIVSYAFAHSALCVDMLQKYKEHKKTFLKRSVKNLKYTLT